jgi:hypothetical protein
VKTMALVALGAAPLGAILSQTGDISTVFTNTIGSIVVTAMFVWFLLKRGDRADDVAKAVAGELTEATKRMSEIKNDFTSYNKAISDSFVATVQQLHADMRSMVNDNLMVTRDSVRAIAELKGAFEQLRGDVARKADREEKKQQQNPPPEKK